MASRVVLLSFLLCCLLLNSAAIPAKNVKSVSGSRNSGNSPIVSVQLNGQPVHRLGTCMVDGRSYDDREVIDDANPCSWCRCNGWSGRPMCLMASCAYPRCPEGVVPITEPGACCLSCPQ